MATPKNPLEAFIWGEGGAALTPEEIARRREIEEALLAKGGVDTSPVGHWTQGLARVANAAAGSFRRGRIEDAAKENSKYNEDLINTLIGGSSSASSMPDASTSAVAQELAGTSPAPVDMSGNEVYGQFIDTVKQGGVQNPFALAAIAATGKAESGFSPGNVTRTWSDPSQSGQAGRAGGIMSWRGPRYQALASTGDLSPAGQAKFFLQENPQLIEALNKAGSVEEAMRLMNNAWKFAGYDQPGGESARRLSYANSFLPTFQTNVASASPQAAIEAVAPGSGYIDPMVSAPNYNPAAANAPVVTEPLAPPAMAANQPASFDERFNAPPAPLAMGAPEIYSEDTGVPPLEPPREVSTLPVASPPPAAPQMQVAQAMGAPQQQAPALNQDIIRALSDPRANQNTRAIAQILLQQQMQANDPLRQLQIQKAQRELNAPNVPDSVQALDMRAQRAGLQPGTPEYNRFMLSGGDKGITINNEGSIPAGYQAMRDPEGRITSIQPIPGSPAALEMEQALKAKQTQGERKETATNVITSAASQARNLIEKGSWVTGTPGRIASNLPESDAAELRRQIEVLKSNATIENLTAMRQASPTGGALGNVTEKEGAMLSAAAGAIDPNAGKEQLAKALDNYERTLLRVIHGPKVGDAIFEQTRQPEGPPAGVAPEDWEFMTPEERRLFQ